MGLFINNIAQADRPGVFALEVAPPKFAVERLGGYIGLVAQFAWGPAQTVVTPESGAELLSIFEPDGSPRTSTGMRALLGRKAAPWKIVRAMGASPVTASAAITGTGGTQTVTAKYPGTLGNSITITYAAAASGDTAKRDITVTLTDPVTGSTIEIYTDCALPAANVAGSIDVSKSLLLASIVIAANASPAWPSNGTTTLSSGTNGSAIASGDYLGTEGTADKGVARLEREADVRVVCVDDCGNSLRAAVNTGLQSHAAFMGDRVAVLQFDPDIASFTALKAALTGSLVSDRVVAAGNWVKVFDQSGTLVQSPKSTMIATAIINNEPHQSHAWWDDVVAEFYSAIQEIVAPFSTDAPQIQKEATSKGLCLTVKTPEGKFVALHDRTASQTTSKLFTVTRRMKDFIALSLKGALTSYVNGPNVVRQQKDIQSICSTFMREQKRLERVLTQAVSTTANNTNTTLSAGQFYVSIDAQTPAPMEKIILGLNVGNTVTVVEN